LGLEGKSREIAMPQDRETGEAGRVFGRECGPRTAELIGARHLGGQSNECVWNGERVVIKCAQRKSKKNPTVGVLTDMLGRLQSVVGVFQQSGPTFEVVVMSASDYQQHMRIRQADEERAEQGMLNYSDFLKYGKPLQTVVFDPPLGTAGGEK
jgi:hypothetical protein